MLKKAQEMSIVVRSLGLCAGLFGVFNVFAPDLFWSINGGPRGFASAALAFYVLDVDPGQKTLASRGKSGWLFGSSRVAS